jgi:hypothetical protein
MLVPGSANPHLLGAPDGGGGGGYAIERSLRFNGPDSASLSKTFSNSPTSTTAWTFSAWVKRFGLGAYGILLTAPGGEQTIRFNPSDQLEFFEFSGGGFQYNLVTTQVFRDPSAWFHLVVVWDTANGTSSNRIRIYVNGQRVTTFGTATYPSSSKASVVNTATSQSIGSGTLSNFYLADIYMLDGTAVSDASTFGEYDATTGVWVPTAPTGLTYGTNGYHLDFADNSTAAALGTDTSGNGNTWTVNNISVTAGAGNDSLVDVPTNGSEVDTGSGGQVRGNYCTWNPLKQSASGVTLTNGNLEASISTSQSSVLGTFGLSSGKWYWENTILAFNNMQLGIAKDNVSLATFIGGDALGWSMHSNGKTYNNLVSTTYGATYGLNDVIGIALDADNGTLTFYKNGTSQGTAFTGLTSGPYFPAFSCTDVSPKVAANFGQRPFAYTAPSGFKALNTANLPAPVITKPSDVMDVKLYTGNGSTQTISGLGFSPDLVWIKKRSAAGHGPWYDVLRGTGKAITSSLTNSEYTAGSTQELTAFNSDGFSLGTDYNFDVNTSSQTFVAWTWDAGTSNATNTSGTITSTVRANISAGFSIVSYTGTGANATVGHGLGVEAALLLVKKRNAGTDWAVYHTSLGGTKYLRLNGTLAATTDTMWNNTSPTSSVFSVGKSESGTGTGDTYVAYCFAPVVGYSSFGSWQNNGSTDGTFVYLGFRPRLILLKNSDNTERWYIMDSSRHAYNVPPADSTKLNPNTSNAEGTNFADTATIDFLSNGFKIRTTDTASGEISFGTRNYVYAAFAESPFQYARAR